MTGKKRAKPENLTVKRRVAGIFELVLGCYALYVGIMALIHLNTTTEAQEGLAYAITGYPMVILGIILISGGILALFSRGFCLAIFGVIIIDLISLVLLIPAIKDFKDVSSNGVISVIVIGVIFCIGILATILLIKSNRDFN